MITRNETKDKLTKNILEDNNTVQTDVEKRMTEREGTGNKDEFNDTVKVDVQGIRGSALPLPFFKLVTGDCRQSKIGWRAQLKWSEHSECVRSCAEIWCPICKVIHQTTRVRVCLMVHLKI